MLPYPEGISTVSRYTMSLDASKVRTVEIDVIVVAMSLADVHERLQPVKAHATVGGGRYGRKPLTRNLMNVEAEFREQGR